MGVAYYVSVSCGAGLKSCQPCVVGLRAYLVDPRQYRYNFSGVFIPLGFIQGERTIFGERRKGVGLDWEWEWELQYVVEMHIVPLFLCA